MPEKYSALLRYLAVPLLPHAVSLHVHMKLSAFFASLSNPSSFQNLCCSALLPLIGILWPLLTSASSTVHRCMGYRCQRHNWQTSTGKNNNLPPTYSLHLLHGVRTVSDFVSSCKLIRPKSALYAVFVHRAGTLPPASFRSHLTMDTLALG
jgi:hypothetical protein